MSSGFQVADLNLTHPQNVAYIIQTTDNVSGSVYTVGPTQISCTMTPTPANCASGTWSLDGYIPSATALGLVWQGSYTLPAASISALGGVFAKDCSALGAGYVVQKINADGTESCVLTSGGTTYSPPILASNTLGGVKGNGSSTTCGTGNHIVGFGSDGTMLCAADPPVQAPTRCLRRSPPFSAE